MPATPILGLTRQALYDNPLTWGDVFNDEVIKLIEEAITGRTVITNSSGTVTLTDTDSVSNQARVHALIMSGTLSGDLTVIIPNKTRSYLVQNATTNSFAVNIKTSSGVAIQVAQGEWAIINCDGSDNVVVAITSSASSPATINGVSIDPSNASIDDVLGFSSSVSSASPMKISIWRDKTFINQTTTAPPASPAEGDKYLIAATATGAWAGKDGQLAGWSNEKWNYLIPKNGMLYHDQALGALYQFDGTSWSAFSDNYMLRKNPNSSVLIPAGGGVGVDSFYRINEASSVENPRTNTISAISGDTITLPNNSDALYFYHPVYMKGVSYVRIWNTTKSPEESAWVKDVPDYTTNKKQLQVLDANDISTWSVSDTIQLGDPTSITPNRVMAFDISQMLQQIYGEVFRQSGIGVKANIVSSQTIGDSLGITPTGIAGTFIAATDKVPYVGGPANGSIFIPCEMLSPISNSNLVFIRESIGSTGGIRLMSCSYVLRN